MNIYGRKVIIRAVEETDAEILYNAINDPYLEKFENGFNFPISLEQQMKWIQNVSSLENNYKWVIEFNKKIVGYTNLINIDWKNRTAWNGIKIFNSENRGMGIGTDTVMAIMKFAFEEMNLNRLEGGILEYNKASYNLYVEKLRWKVEGEKRSCVYKDNKFHNEFMVAILKEDYLELIKDTNYWSGIKISQKE